MISSEQIKATRHSINEYKGSHNDSGFGFGHGQISRKKQLESGELTSADEQKGVYYIQQDASYVQVEVLDDGCGDGRVTIKITQVTADGAVEFSRSAYRAKVFGGGAVMSAAALIGIGSIKLTATEQFDGALDVLDIVGIKYGAHDDDHSEGPKCGCGAIDNYPTIILATQEFKDDIYNTLVHLFGDSFDESAFNKVINNYQQASGAQFDGYKGTDIKQKITRKGAVIKKLGGRHQEDFLVLNFVKNSTLNQYGLYEFTQNKAQAFSVDVWRVEEYAEKISNHYKKSKTEAFYSMLIYTLATSAVLTDGSQRVFIRQ